MNITICLLTVYVLLQALQMESRSPNLIVSSTLLSRAIYNPCPWTSKLLLHQRDCLLLSELSTCVRSTASLESRVNKALSGQ